MESHHHEFAKKIDQQPVLGAVTFSLDRGQVVGLVGPNGIGKTTIFSHHHPSVYCGWRNGEG